jgi:FkbM family methyltransferase
MNAIEPFAVRILAGTELILVDVGAAHGVPAHLSGLERLATVCYFEPHLPAAEALRKRNVSLGLTKARVFTEALSDSDGTRTLYVTNTPTGSSLLKPGGDFTLEFNNMDYFYPMREVPVATRALAGVLREASMPRFDGIKIDVQGAELYVVKGIGAQMLDDALSVEMEIGFPGGYLDQPGFADIDPVMTDAGFTLFDLRVASLHRDHNGDFNYYTHKVFKVLDNSKSLTKRIAEADAVYFKRADRLVERGDLAAIRRAVVLRCAYGFFIEALVLIDKALAARLLDEHEHRKLHDAVVGWQRCTKDIVLDWLPIAWALNRAVRVWQIVQQKFFGRYFGRWPN